MFDFTQRAQMIYGEKAMELLAGANVCLLGVGGVGSYALEALVRSGIGNITIVDKDIVEKSNINRQLVALNSTLGMAKVSVGAARAKDINPEINMTPLEMFYLRKEDLDFSPFDYVIDAIDNVTGKLAIACACEEVGVPLISAMGCGNRKDPGLFKVADIYETSGCPLCKIMRKELKERGIKKLKVVYSTEQYVKTESRSPGSTAFAPAAAGLMLAAEVVNNIADGVKG